MLSLAAWPACMHDGCKSGECFSCHDCVNSLGLVVQLHLDLAVWMLLMIKVLARRPDLQNIVDTLLKMMGYDGHAQDMLV